MPPSFPAGHCQERATFPFSQELQCFPARQLGFHGVAWACLSPAPAFCTFLAAVRVVLASLVDNLFPAQPLSQDHKVYYGDHVQGRARLQAGTVGMAACLAVSALFPSCSPFCCKTKLYQRCQQEMYGICKS